MGVPKFFRYISERYPCLSELVKEYQVPEFDNLYLDMNGIIHMCSHPNDFDPHFRISEEQIFKDIFHYIEILFRLIQPQRLFFMAVDGVAPQAKMNQQRGRRFQSAKEAIVLEQKAKEKGESLPKEERFDSNCITPGTMFMTRLQAQLKYFVACKISTNKLWQKVKVILSGHETPGEGEHKIMDYIRYQKAQPGYDPNTRHCLYGLDADLIMLGLCTHEPHFSLLREEVKFGKQTKRNTAPEVMPFYLLHLSLMREYIELEFQALKQALPFPYDLERIIDDWVLMGFLVGNDFIPHLPDMHINTGALPMLYTAYIDILPSLGGYINVGGTLHLDRFQKYLEKLSSFDLNQFRDVYADSKYFEGKTGRRPNTKERKSYKKADEMNPAEDNRYQDPVLAELIYRTQKELEEDGDSGEDDDDSVVKWKGIKGGTEEERAESVMYSEFFQHKNNYYTNKMDFNGGVTRSILRSQAEGYVRAIQWILHYYYNGCVSWSWFYPHHYAPYISDVKDFAHLKIEFELGEPFLPFQQLLAVLPSASKSLLPEPFQELMVDIESPIINFYPTDFRTDLNGKRQEWEAVVLIPFIEQDALLKAMATCSDRLTDEEKRRNSHGPMIVYSYTEENLGEFEAPEYFSNLTVNHARETLVWREEIAVERSKLLKGLCPGVKLDVYYPGFPTLKHITYTAQLKKAKVKVFENASREDNMILTVSGHGHPKVAEVASQLLNKIIYVEWPHLVEARVVAVSDLTERHALDPLNDQPCMEHLNADLSSQWVSSCNGITERYMVRHGVDIGETEIVVYCCTMQGRKHAYGQSGKITLEKQWSSIPRPFALQTTVRGIATYDPEFQQYCTLEEVFPPNTTCFMLGSPYYGAQGTVMEGGKNGRIKLSVTVPIEPDFETVHKAIQMTRSSYMPSNVVAQRLGINTLLLSRITGSILVVNSNDEDSYKTNIGLNLKFTKKNEEVVGYTRKENTYWHYSVKAMDLVHSYMVAFPMLFDYLAQNTGDDIFYAEEIFATGEHKLSDVTSWLKKQPFMNAERQPCGSELMEEELVGRVEQTVDDLFQLSSHKGKTLVMQVKPHLLYQPKLRLGKLSPDAKATHRLLDRVVNVRDCYSVPLALRGTIIGLNKADNEADLMFDVVFDKVFPGGMKINCSKGRGYRISAQSMLNLSYGARLEAVKTPKPTAIVQPSGCKSENGSQMGNRPSSAFATWNVNTNPRKQPPPHLMHLHGFAAPALIPDLQSQENRFQPAQPPQQRQNMAQPKTEFQAMWSELQKVSPQPVPVAQPPAGMPSVTRKQEITTDALKKILKITDGFDTISQTHSYQEPAKAEAVKTYCLDLMNHFKILGLGCPRYNYIVNKNDGTTMAQLRLPDGREFISTPSTDKREAEESVAKMVMTEVLGVKEPQRGRVKPPAPKAMPPQPFQPPARMFPVGWGHMGATMPPSLPTPPQKWYQGNSQEGHLEWRQPRYHPPPQAARNTHSFVAQFTQNKPYLASGNGSTSSSNWRIPVPAELVPPQASQQPRPMNTTRTNRKTFISQEPCQRPQSGQQKMDPPAPSSAVPSKTSTDDQPTSQQKNGRKSRIAASFSVCLE